MSLDALSATLTHTANVTATKNVAGFQNGIVNANNASKQQNFTHAVANSAAYGVDECFNQLLSIAASGTATIDLSNFTDAAGVAACTLVGGRLKAWRFHLLGASELAPDGATQGTACSGVAIGNAGSNPHPLQLSSATTTQDVNNASILQYGDGSSAGFAVTSSAKVILITNLDSVNAAKVVITLLGCTN